MSESDVLGPLDYLVVEFLADRANPAGEVAQELTALWTATSCGSWTRS